MCDETHSWEEDELFLCDGEGCLLGAHRECLVETGRKPPAPDAPFYCRDCLMPPKKRCAGFCAGE